MNCKHCQCLILRMRVNTLPGEVKADPWRHAVDGSITCFSQDGKPMRRPGGTPETGFYYTAEPASEAAGDENHAVPSESVRPTDCARGRAEA